MCFRSWTLQFARYRSRQDDPEFEECYRITTDKWTSRTLRNAAMKAAKPFWNLAEQLQLPVCYEAREHNVNRALHVKHAFL